MRSPQAAKTWRPPWQAVRGRRQEATWSWQREQNRGRRRIDDCGPARRGGRSSRSRPPRSRQRSETPSQFILPVPPGAARRHTPVVLSACSSGAAGQSRGTCYESENYLEAHKPLAPAQMRRSLRLETGIFQGRGSGRGLDVLCGSTCRCIGQSHVPDFPKRRPILARRAVQGGNGGPAPRARWAIPCTFSCAAAPFGAGRRRCSQGAS